MNERLKQDLNDMTNILDEVKNQGLLYLDHLQSRPTSNSHEKISETSLPVDGLGAKKTLKFFKRIWNR